MSQDYHLLYTLSQKRFRRKLKSKHKKKAKRFRINLKHLVLRKILGKPYTYLDVLQAFLPKNIKYLLFDCYDSSIHLNKLSSAVLNSGRFYVPVEFSLIDTPEESYQFINDLVSALVLQKAERIIIDYSKCKRVTMDAQIFLDVIIKDVITFYKRCKEYKQLRPSVLNIKGDNVIDIDVRKMLYSVGSPAIHSNATIRFKDIVPYKLCIHNSLSNNPKTIERKDIDTTRLADYVLDSLSRLNRKLTPEKLEDLCIVISEILINAEEHSSNKYRYSIGYFTEKNVEGKHFGVFRLVIMNFGQTIYEKFKDPDCPNKNVVQKMKELSNSYNKRKLFIFKEFEEETLWTLYSLQEGVTSTDPQEYKKRGNGSIRFIESFFNIKGEKRIVDDFSKMTIISGNTQIVFDGSYNIVRNKRNNENFQYITFNESGNIMNKPDAKFVKFADNYFPGTIISAEMLFNEDDLE
ncbi:hypothetical protein [Pedobacter miscanthi]|uniref:hypothetical protein n=1 Tax=Pedobacter miscanthi TaxID=2259170 RepID=UPI00292CCE64|nr:hypothetical protein [Pedobacter miscanthi]